MKIKRRTLLHIKKWLIRIVVLGVASFLFYEYFCTGIVSITSYDIRGVDDASRLSIDTDAHAIAFQKRYKIFPSNKIFTYNTPKIREAVRTAVPDVATISIQPVGLHTLRITVTRLTPLFRMNDSQALTKDGIIFTTKNDIHTYPLFVAASSTTKNLQKDGILFSYLVVDDKIIDSDFLAQVTALSEKVSSVIFKVGTVSVSAKGDVSFIDEQGVSTIFFLKDMDTTKVWSTLVSAIDTDPLKTQLAENKDKLEYLDARYGNKVFYKFGDASFQKASTTAIIENHATTTEASSSPR